jgi:hypothetical protein
MNSRIVPIDRHNSPRSATRLAVAIVLGAFTLACATALPHRRAGSDITLPDSPARRALQALASPCDRPTDSLSVTARAKDVVGCGGASTDTVAANDPQRTSTSPKTP